jgi:hypothetical protein
MNPKNVDWQTPAGILLSRLAEKLSPHKRYEIVVFGSAPLQVCLKPDFISHDVDIIGNEAEIEKIASEIKGKVGNDDLIFQVCDYLTFRTALGWQERAIKAPQHGHTFIFPHPWDILVSKIGRLEEKDLEAFRLVIRETGHPTATEFKQHLQLAVDLYRPNFDEERGSDYTTQTRILWKTIFQSDIDVRKEIISPALQRRQASYDQDSGSTALKERLANLKLQ